MFKLSTYVVPLLCDILFTAAVTGGFLLFGQTANAQDRQSILSTGSPQAAGREVFIAHCASCHGTNANGGEFAPSILTRVPLRSNEELITLLHNGIPSSGMPAFPTIVGEERSHLISFLRTLKPAQGSATAHTSVTLETGSTLQGVTLNRSASDLQLLGEDQKLHLLRKTPSGRYREVTSQTDWASYDGRTLGNRYSELSQINSANVSQLRTSWIFSIRTAPRELQGTPVVVGGIMYITTVNECYALDAGSGRLIWHYQRSRSHNLASVAGTGVNRGVSVGGDRLFLQTDNAHLIALNRFTGALLWDVTMGDTRENYGGTGAPLTVGDTVVSGISGGDSGARGFIAAYEQSTGHELWRFWTVPAPGEPGSETWKGSAIEHPGGATWMTGEYDPELNTIYWPVGNPDPDLIGDDRIGDNLYTDSVVALDPSTGKLKWHFQFTPHDVHDFDAMAPLAIIDANWEDKPRKLMIQANRNGFYYVLDRTDGKFLFGTPFTKKLTWASGLDSQGHPIPLPNQIPTHEGTLICPWLSGATNWYATSYNPGTGLYYVQTNDKCGIYIRRDQQFKIGGSLMGGSNTADPADPGQRILRAFDIHTGKAAWELPQVGGADTGGGVLSTAGNLVFFGSDDYSFAAADAKTGKLLWSFQTNQPPHASAMTYLFDHKQYVAISSGNDILVFSLPDTL